MSLDRTKEEIKTIPNILAVDFDGTLVIDQFPKIGPIIKPVWDAVQETQKKGWKIVLWSCRNGDALKEAVEFCSKKGLHFDAINENIDEVKIVYGGDTRKVFADLYLDDRNCIATFQKDLARVRVLEGYTWD